MSFSAQVKVVWSQSSSACDLPEHIISASRRLGRSMPVDSAMRPASIRPMLCHPQAGDCSSPWRPGRGRPRRDGRCRSERSNRPCGRVRRHRSCRRTAPATCPHRRTSGRGRSARRECRRPWHAPVASSAFTVSGATVEQTGNDGAGLQASRAALVAQHHGIDLVVIADAENHELRLRADLFRRSGDAAPMSRAFSDIRHR